MKGFALKKNEILRNKKCIEKLFEQRKGFIQYPLRCVYSYTIDSLTQESKPIDAKTLFVVGKRYHKRAVKRNLVRRRIKEAFRLRKGELYFELDDLKVVKIDMAILFVGREESPYADIENSINLILRNIVRHIKKNINSDTTCTD